MDVCAAKLSWTNPDVRGFEVKVTRSDFLADVNSGKFRRYLGWVDLFYFATPSGLVKKSEIPEGCGLVVRGENGWSGVRAPRRTKLSEVDRAGSLLALFMNLHGFRQQATRSERLARYMKDRSLRSALSEQLREMLREADGKERQYDQAVNLMRERLNGGADEGISLPVLVKRLCAQHGATKIPDCDYELCTIRSAADRIESSLSEAAGRAGVTAA